MLVVSSHFEKVVVRYLLLPSMPMGVLDLCVAKLLGLLLGVINRISLKQLLQITTSILLLIIFLRTCRRLIPLLLLLCGHGHFGLAATILLWLLAPKQIHDFILIVVRSHQNKLVTSEYFLFVFLVRGLRVEIVKVIVRLGVQVVLSLGGRDDT
jgi:hypothetical protein